MRLMLIASLIALLPACSERIEVPAKPVEPHVPRKITIHGEDADAFYKNLRFAVEGDCKKYLRNRETRFKQCRNWSKPRGCWAHFRKVR